MCPRSSESQQYPGLHQKKRSWQVEGGDTAPLLCSGVTSPGVLHPDVESSVQERHGACPEKGHKNYLWNVTLLLSGQAERAGAVQPGAEKAVRCPDSGLSVSKGELQERRSQTLTGEVLEQVAQRCGGCPIPGDFQDKDGSGSGQSDLSVRVPIH